MKIYIPLRNFIFFKGEGLIPPPFLTHPNHEKFPCKRELFSSFFSVFKKNSQFFFRKVAVRI